MYRMNCQFLARARVILLIIMVIPELVSGQETNYGPGYQTMLVNNPALSGNNGAGNLRMSYLNFYPGHGYNFHSVYSSYDAYFQELHGGAGIYLSNDYLGGIINDLRGGVSYSYFLQAQEDLYINAGLSASFYHRGFNFDKAVLPDQIDPLGGVTIPSSEILENRSRTLFDVGAGVVFISGKYFGGFSMLHLTRPDLGGSASSGDNLKRKIMIHMAADYELNRIQHLNLRPLLSAEFQGSYISVSAGAALEMRSLSASAVLIMNNNGSLDVQPGFSVRREQVSLFYNYRFNIKSENSLLPFTLMHQAGVAFSLNDVKKRIKVRTINYPQL